MNVMKEQVLGRQVLVDIFKDSEKWKGEGKSSKVADQRSLFGEERKLK